MSYLRSEMLYDNGKYYKWSAKADHDNPYYTIGTDSSELNRTEGYEVLYFINHLAKKHWTDPSLAIFQKIERIIRSTPGYIKSHRRIEDWILQIWNSTY